MRADGDEMNHVLIFNTKDGTIIAGHINASAVSIRVVERMVIENEIKRICQKQVPTPFKLFL